MYMYLLCECCLPSKRNLHKHADFHYVYTPKLVQVIVCLLVWCLSGWQ